MTGMRRRAFVGGAALAASGLAQQTRPNILWITCEDTGPQLGCYGDTFAVTPNLDALAARSLRYLYCWSNAPVCAPARTTIISGLYPPSTGAEHMRSELPLPASFRMFPGYLREAGYYCTNNSKEDYNLTKPPGTWDESSNQAHWRNRKPGQPFFAVFNFTQSHESQIRRRPHKLAGDPSKVRVRAYHPDTPEVRHDWTQYYDNIRTVDGLAAKVLDELRRDGLDQDTIVFFFGDHGSGMPRSKRWPFNSGLHVPLLIHIPDKFRRLAAPEYRPGGVSERLVSFVDLAPTVLSLAGIKPPEHFQGFAFHGPHTAPEQPYIYGFRGRMDERIDMVRSVRDKRYVYLRHYMPHRIYGQHVAYMFETPTTQVWHRLYHEGKLNAAQRKFWETKPSEELFDLQSDPDETVNLASSPEHRATLERMRKAQRALAARIRDVGFLPEGEIHSRSKGSTPYEYGHSAAYPYARIAAAAEAAADPGTSVASLSKGLKDPDSAVRYWSAQGLLAKKEAGVNAALRAALADSSPYVRAIAAEALGRYGGSQDVEKALDVLLELAPADRHGVHVSILALNALDALDGKAASRKELIGKLPREAPPGTPQRMTSYIPRLIEKTLKDLGS